MAVALLMEHAGARVDGGVQSFEGVLPGRAQVTLEWSYLDKLIGVALDRDRGSRHPDRLGHFR